MPSDITIRLSDPDVAVLDSLSNDVAVGSRFETIRVALRLLFWVRSQHRGGRVVASVLMAPADRIAPITFSCLPEDEPPTPLKVG